ITAPNEQVFPYSHFGIVTTGKSVGNSNYHGMIATAKYEGRKGTFFQASYTLGKSLDDHSGSFQGTLGETQAPADNNNRRLERGPSTFDVRHRAVFVYAVDLPAGPGHWFLGWSNSLNRAIFGGWQVSGITTLETGAPFTVITGGTDTSGLNTGADRPDV